MKEIKITKNEEGQRLDRFLKKYLNKANQSFIHKMIRKKNIKVNGLKAGPDIVLKTDDTVQLYLSDETIDKFRDKKTLQKTDIHFDIVYEDDNILVVNKPIGLSTQPDKTGKKNLVDEIKVYLDAKEENISFTFKPAVCNRLDKNTSGLVIAAKNYDALKQTNKAIRERKIRKYYMAKVHGIIKDDLELKDYLIKKDNKNMVKIINEYRENSKSVITYAHPLKREGKYTWLEVEIETGRAHQIRAHLASIGHPIAGDKKYGKKDNEKYQVLHAYKLLLDGFEGNLSYLNGMEIVSDISERKIL
ncbi:MAG TPA: RluA family pseudouridine synthase [Sedimentibacter sp.]|jgi:23S rRNA pseudouridine955/2504/2580 synthase|nr:RluA family pseudouridine synthase [Sedimentibacter sp.]NLA13747.1 RluA family pseudouridine synthase [Tissierellia bacterium]HOA18847.1 RluA family pseudouridine synthase [Sedimentibacter sp.]HOT22185.1 RluA family pseudouridine synthase [Sedimentibacter sp.]HPB80334.1 RluA family pseudouridine synthase [Sedimentibacter sp.]